MLQKTIFIVLLVLYSVCAQRSKAQVNSNCKKLNSQGVDSLIRYKGQFKKRRSTLEASLHLLNDAIRCDTSLNTPRVNRITVLSELGEYSLAINSIDDLIQRNKDTTLLLIKASIYDKMGENKLSIDADKMAYNYFVRKLKENPQNQNVIYCKLMTQSKVFGLDNVRNEIDFYLKKYPNDTHLKYLLEGILTPVGIK